MKDLKDLSHDDVMTACSNVRELINVWPHLAKNKALTGRLLYRCDSVEDLRTVGFVFENALVGETFMQDYLQSWKSVGVPISLLALIPTLPSNISPEVVIIIIVIVVVVIIIIIIIIIIIYILSQL